MTKGADAKKMPNAGDAKRKPVVVYPVVGEEGGTEAAAMRKKKCGGKKGGAVVGSAGAKCGRHRHIATKKKSNDDMLGDLLMKEAQKNPQRKLMMPAPMALAA